MSVLAGVLFFKSFKAKCTRKSSKVDDLTKDRQWHGSRQVQKILHRAKHRSNEFKLVFSHSWCDFHALITYLG